MITDALKDTIADAIHLAVCDYTESDGVGHCYYYTAAGFILASYATGLDFQPQVGSLHLRIDEPDGWFHMECENGGMERGEFHAWLVVPDETRRFPAVWADFSTRHWKELTQRTQNIHDAITTPGGTIFVMDPHQEHIPWSRPSPPKYLWSNGLPPEWIQCQADLPAMQTFARSLHEHNSELARLHRAVWHYWVKISRERGVRAAGNRT